MLSIGFLTSPRVLERCHQLVVLARAVPDYPDGICWVLETLHPFPLRAVVASVEPVRHIFHPSRRYALAIFASARIRFSLTFSFTINIPMNAGQPHIGS